MKDPVVYQIYPRSFQDSNGDGIGDLKGVISRLDYLADLGVDAIWLSPIFKSPMADYGYDVSDYYDIADDFGTLADAQQMIAEAHERGIAVILDMILAHTSIENAWFSDEPDLYIRADRPLNNWKSVFGGSMWSKDPYGDGYYMHRYYPEQPDLNWRNPKTRDRMYDVMRFWRDQGVDGFRLDAIDGLYRHAEFADMPEEFSVYDGTLQGAAARTGYDTGLPELFAEFARMRDAFPDTFFVTEAFRPVEELVKYTAHMDVSFNFDFLFGDLTAESLANVLRRSDNEHLAWVLSNHDFSRLVSRVGRDLARVAAVLLFTLPGAAFIYQGDEIGMVDGPGGSHDVMGRDKFRHPMQWNATGGFTTGEPWLPMMDPAECNVADQQNDTSSMLSAYKELIRMRKQFEGPLQSIETNDDVLTFKRNNIEVVCNLGPNDVEVENGTVPAHSALILNRT